MLSKYGLRNYLNFIGCLYVPGAIIWSCLIAIYRMIYITSKQGIIHERWLLRCTVAAGLCLHSLIFTLMLRYGEGSLVNKICTHYSSAHIQILQENSVRKPGKETFINYVIQILRTFEINNILNVMDLTVAPGGVTNSTNLSRLPTT